VRGVGATPVLRTSRVGCRRAGRSHPTHTRDQPWTGSGTGLSLRQYRVGSGV